MEILNYKSIGKGFLLARFDVRIPQWKVTFRNCSLFDKDGKKWISLPNQSFKDENGITKYFPLVVFEKSVKERFDGNILAKIAAGDFTHENETDQTQNKGK
jgi:hypothetical protein